MRLLLCFATVFSAVYHLTLSSSLYKEPWGKERELIAKQKLPSPIQEVETNPMIDLADALISFHKTYLSPTTCKRSHYRPTSSTYMRQAIKRYGFWQGFIMGCDRLLRENDERWVYKLINHEEGVFKYDPALKNKYQVAIDY